MAYGIGEVRGMRDIGKNIRTLRERRGLTQEELAQALFVTRQTVSNYETGKSRPDIDMLMKIAQVLETDVDQVLYGPRPVEDRRREIWRLIAALGGMAVLVLLWALLGDGETSQKRDRFSTNDPVFGGKTDLVAVARLVCIPGTVAAKIDPATERCTMGGACQKRNAGLAWDHCGAASPDAGVPRLADDRIFDMGPFECSEF